MEDISCMNVTTNNNKEHKRADYFKILSIQNSNFVLRNVSEMSSVPLFNDPKATAKVQSCLKEVYKCVQAVEKERAANVEGCQAAIEEAHDKIHNDQRLTVAMRNRLKSLYEEGVRNAEKVLWCPFMDCKSFTLTDSEMFRTEVLFGLGNTVCHCSHFA